MTRQTLTQRKGLAAYRDMARDTRTAGKRHADVREWSSTPAEPVVQMYKPATDDLRAINRLIRILTLALFVFLALVWFTPDVQLLLEAIRGAK